MGKSLRVQIAARPFKPVFPVWIGGGAALGRLLQIGSTAAETPAGIRAGRQPILEKGG